MTIISTVGHQKQWRIDYDSDNIRETAATKTVSDLRDRPRHVAKCGKTSRDCRCKRLTSAVQGLVKDQHQVTM